MHTLRHVTVTKSVTHNKDHSVDVETHKVLQVGHYDPNGSWHHLEQFEIRDQPTAERYVNYLNGGIGLHFNEFADPTIAVEIVEQ